MSPFSWQAQNLCGLSLAFILDWRVVAHLINFVNHDGHEIEKFVKTDNPILVLIKFPHDITELLFGRVLAQSSHHHTHLFDVNDAILVLVKNAEHLPEPKDSFLFH